MASFTAPTTPPRTPPITIDLTVDDDDDDGVDHFRLAGASDQLALLFALLDVKEGDEDFLEAKYLGKKLKKRAKKAIKYITITSGENAGEKRQIFKDHKGQPFFLQGHKNPKKQFLTDYIDDNGIKRSPNASNRALQQYAVLMDNAKPEQLFLDDDPPPQATQPHKVYPFLYN